MRDSTGRFLKGHTETREEKVFRLQRTREGWKNCDRYIHYLIKEQPYIYNSWRAFMFTRKGKMAGVSEEWRSFKNFHNDMSSSYREGLRLIRIDKKLPFSKENCMWVEDELKGIINNNCVKLEYEGEELTLKEWAIKYELNLTGIKIRYHRHKNYSIEEILFGKKIAQVKRKIDISELTSEQKLRDKASKMLSAYRFRDRKRGREFDLSTDWFINNILKAQCVYCGDTSNLGCDRIDNMRGHTFDNVVACCYSCNITRQDNFSFDEMKILGRTICRIKKMRTGSLEKLWR